MALKGWLEKARTGGFKPLAILFAALLPLLPVAAAALTPQFQAAGTPAAGTASVAPAWPAHQIDDVALLFVEAAGGEAITLTTPNGFTQVLNSPQATGAGTAGTRLAVFWARATSAAMAAPVVADPGDHAYAVILTFRNVINNGDPWDATVGGVKTPASTTIPATGVTTTVPDTLIVHAVTKDLDANGAFVTTTANANLTGLTERFDNGSNTGTGGGVAVVTGTRAVAGATGNTTFTITSSINAFLTIALKPLTPPVISGITSVQSRDITAAWQLVGGATGYTLAASLSPANPPTAIVSSSDTTGASASVYSPALAPNTTHYLFVRSNGPRQSSWWNAYPATATLLAYPPLEDGFTNVGAASLQFNWSANGNAYPGTRFRVISSASSDFSSPVSSETYNLYWNRTGLAANTTYYFKVAGVNHNNVETDYTLSSATATLVANAPAFNGFSGVTSGGAQFNWGLNGNPAGLRYLVESSDDPGFASPVSSYTYNLSLSSSGLTANTTYYFRVAALNHNGVPTAWAQSSTSTLLAFDPAFNGFSGVGSDSMQFNWTSGGNPYPATLYRVTSSSSSNFTSPVHAYTYDLSYSSSGLKADTTYYFKVVGLNHNSVPTFEADGSTATLLAFPPALDAFGTVAAGAIQFRWLPNGNAQPGTRWHVQSSRYDDFSQAVSSYTYNISLSSSGLAANTTYYFRVSGVNHNGVSTAYADTASTATLLAFDPAFSGFTGVTRAAAQFNWNHNGNLPGTLYRVLSSKDQAFSVAETSDTYNNYLSSAALTANTTYYFKVFGLNHNGVATAEASSSTSTLAAQPSGAYFAGTGVKVTQLNWSPEDNPAGTRYRVLVTSGPDVFASAGAPVTSSDTYNVALTTSGLVADTEYRFAVRAFNNNGVATDWTLAGPERTLQAGQIGAPVPGAVSVSVSSISASWSLVASATGYTLVASLADDPAAPFASSTTIGDTSAYVFEPALSPDTVYYLFVRANGEDASGAWTPFGPHATRLQYQPAFDKFSGITHEDITFDWTANGNADPGTNYRVRYSTAPDPLAPNGAAVSSSDTYNTFLAASGLDANTTYYFRAAGLNRDGLETGYIAARATSTLADTPIFSGFETVAAGSIKFTWSPDANRDGTLYRVLVSTAPDVFNPDGAPVSSSFTYNTYLSTSGLLADTAYHFRAAGINNNGVLSPYSAMESTATLLAFPPAFDGFGTVTAGVIQFRWTANGNRDPGTLYRVISSTYSDMADPQGAVVESSRTYALSLSSAGLAANTTYYFQAAGLNKNDVATAYTARKETATLAEMPLTAVSTFSAVDISGFTAAWEPGNNPPGTLYTVMASTAADFNAGVTDQVTASTRPEYGYSYSFSGLAFSTVYHFQVRAVNHNGVGTAYAQLGSTRTLSLGVPAPGAVTDAGTNYLTANWGLVPGATGYTLAASVNPGAEPSPVYASSTTVGAGVVSASVLNPALAVNTTYYLFVRANGPRESGAWAPFPAASTLANPPVTAVTTFTSVGYNGFAVSWGANGNPLGSTVYDVQVSSAPDFNPGATDRVAFATAPVYGPGAEFTSLNVDTYYYFRVRAEHNGGGETAWVNLGYTKTKALPVIHAAGDGVLFYGQAGNNQPQYRNYTAASNNFSAVSNTLQSGPGSLFVIKTNPLDSKQEAVAGYVKDGVLRVLCTDGSNWYEEWSQAVGGNETTRRFDIAYEKATGDVMVLYSKNAAATNELGYRTRPGDADCGSGGWTADTPLDAVRTSGIVQWVKLAADQRASSSTLAAIWADANSDLSARIWSGTAWESEPGAALETSLEVVAAAQDVEDFDVEFEALSGDVMVVWANSAGANGTNGVRYAAWTETTRQWGAVTTPPTFIDDATNLDLASNPKSNEMVFASIGNAGSDLQIGYWSGTAWTNTANVDITAAAPLAGNRLVAAVWLSSNTTNRWVVAYNDSAATNIGWYYGTTGAPTAGTDAAPLPAFGSPQRYYDLKQDPVNTERAILTVSDLNSDLFAKRLAMTSAPAFTWTDAAGGAALEANLSSAAVGGYSFAFWPAPPVATFEQSSYRVFANADSADVGAPLALADSAAQLPAAGSAFRLRATLHVGNVQVPVSGRSFKLQYAGRGDGACEAPANGDPAAYTDVTAATLIAFNNNSPADGAALTPNASDPRHGAHPNVAQTYEEQNNFTNSVAAIPRNQDALWDLALKDNGMQAGTVYCLRIVEADGTALNAYAVYPQVYLPAPLYINEVYPSGAGAANDWVEFYNNTQSTVSLVGWKLYYVENTIDLGGTPNLVWTGAAGQVVNAMSTYTVSGPSMDLNGAASYHVRLENTAPSVVDQVQWPALSAGQSFARIADGNPDYFEVDPTPTKNYANAVDTDTFRINEVNYGAVPQYIEIYNSSPVSTRTLAGYYLRSANAAAGGAFRFTRKVYPQNYLVIDSSSVDDAGRKFTEVFGAQGLNPSGDFLALENSTGSVVDAVTWQGDVQPRYNYRAEPAPYANAAPANAALSIARVPSEGYDSGSDAADFAVSTAATPASRNNGAGYAAANTLYYPENTQEPRYLARRFPVSLKLGADSGGGGADNLLFMNIGGTPDPRSPHIYRLADLGLSTASVSDQSVPVTGLSANDQDGYPLVAGARYRVTLNSDTGPAAAPPIVLPDVTYEASAQSLALSSAAPVRMNNATRAALFRLDLHNNGAPASNSLILSTVAFRLLDQDAAALGQAQARALFDALLLVREASSGNNAGVYEPAIDLSTVAYVPMGQIAVDALGFSTLTVPAAYLQQAAVPAASTATFYVVAESTADADEAAVNVFRARLDGAYAQAQDAAGGLRQDLTFGPALTISSVALIAPAAPPPGTVWPVALPPAALAQTVPAVFAPDMSTPAGPASVSTAVYTASTDGYVRARAKDGSQKWAFPTVSLSPVRTAPLVREEGAGVYLYFASDNGYLYKIRDNDSSAGTEWQVLVGVAVSSAIADIDDDPRIFFGGSDNAIHCRAKSNGASCGAGWPAAINSRVTGTLVLDLRATVNSVWVGLENGDMLNLKLDQLGSPAYKNTGGAIRSSPLLDAYNANPSNTVYFTSTDGILYARVSSNMSTLPGGWSDYLGSAGTPVRTSPFMTYAGTKYIFYGDDAGRLHKVNAATGAGEAGWPFQAGGAVRSSPVWVANISVPQGGRDYVYFGCDDGYIYAIDAETRAHRQGWPVATGGPIRSDIVVDTGTGTLVAESADGKTYVLKISQ